MTINDIIKEAIYTLQTNHTSITPDNYLLAFCKIAKQRGFVIEDCERVDRFTKKLNSSVQKELLKYNIENINEFLTFLVSYINRNSANEANQRIDIMTVLVKRLLQTITMLHDRKAKDLAAASLERLEYLQDVKSFELIKNKWFDFLSSYDDSYLNRLKTVCHTSSDDLESIVNDVVNCFKKHDDTAVYENIGPLLIAALSPSIAPEMDDALATITYELRNSPEILSSRAMQDDIRSLIKKRIYLDKEELKHKAQTLDKLLEDVSYKIIGLIDRSNLSTQEIRKIKTELSQMNYSKDSFEAIRTKLIKIASSLEVESDSLAVKMKKDSTTIDKLYKRVNKLESALSKAKLETKKDFLTDLLSKRALHDELKRVEKSYERYGINYSICFFDLDDFKMVNDTYGHEAGDVILSNFGKLLKKFTRDVDIAGRYGGEEFIVILPNTDLKGAEAFGNKIREAIQTTHFLYKNEMIEATVSAGVVERRTSQNQKEMIEISDKRLYKAKDLGKNRVMAN